MLICPIPSTSNRLYLLRCLLQDDLNVPLPDLLLGALGNYGGSTQTLPLLPDSSAIDAGDDNLYPAADHRGVARPQGAHCDIGAFESQGFTLSSLMGMPQSTLATTAFGTPLGLVVTANASGELVDGGLVTFTAPSSGASATLTGSPATISSSQVSIISTANKVAGSYDVSAEARGAAPASFQLANEPAADLGVTMSTDSLPTDVKITYAITVTNTGPHAAQSVVLTDRLPAGTTLVKVMTTMGECRAGRDKIITCDLDTLELNQSVSITLIIKQSARRRQLSTLQR